ncbi:MAG: phosphoribosylformylglycinamidine synthase I [Candidatus Omnitrophica bacterium]|nr:phosphoribosylformylglycinamidine synthase I [Candidatus Omnitrophota bacterium]MDD5575191.1 phosphoribosylformylglycinamidine synthase I [Candidatus Omnitrophota bacterium]
MPKPRVLILKTAGTNCDLETAFAFESAGAVCESVHVNELSRRERRLLDFQILAISGGFSYGDDISAGKILANELKYKLCEDLAVFIRSERLMIGICNGFQVLVKAGLLPGSTDFAQEATLALNDGGVFRDQWVHLKREESRCVWTRGCPEVILLPIAHGEGKFIPKNEEVLDRLKANGQIVFRYSDAKGRCDNACVNPNGSIEAIAGICDETGRVFGLMPHPERHLVSLQHPQWTRLGLARHGDGFQIFLNAVNFFK